MKKWRQIKQVDCTELLTDGHKFVLVEWGFATNGTGIYNEFGTDTAVYLWVGESEEFDTDIGTSDPRWEAIAGFNQYDATEKELEEKYEQELEKILKEV